MNTYKTYSWTYNEKLWSLQNSLRVDLESDLGTTIDTIYDDFMSMHSKILTELEYYDKLSSYITHSDTTIVEVIKNIMQQTYNRIVDIQQDLQKVLRCGSDETHIFDDLMQAVNLLSTIADKKNDWNKFVSVLEHIDKINYHYYTHIVPLSDDIEKQEFLEMDDERIIEANKTLTEKVLREKNKIADLPRAKIVYEHMQR